MPLPAQHELLNTFRAFLSESGLSKVSVKNYVSDVRKFIEMDSRLRGNDTTNDNVCRAANDHVLPSPSVISKFVAALQDSQVPHSTINRYLASLRRYSVFLKVKYEIDTENRGQSTENSATPMTPDPCSLITGLFLKSLQNEDLSHSTVKNYKSDLNHFLSWTANTTNDNVCREGNAAKQMTDLSSILSPSSLDKYQDHLKIDQTSSSVINRRISTLKKFVKFALTNKLISVDPFQQSAISNQQSGNPLAFFRRFTRRPSEALAKGGNVGVFQKISNIRYQISNIKLYRKYNALPFVPYLHLAILVLFVALLANFGYDQIVTKAVKSQAYPATPTRPTRQLSFQGRLTDSSDTPITVATNVTFKLYNALTGGSQLYTSGTCSVTPDQDGIFNTLIGDTTCGAEIDNTVFSENQSVYMEVVVGATTLTPRQQIATVGYALNTETLQGYPISSTASATRSTVAVMNQYGEVILGEQSPVLKSVSGTFNLQGQTLSLSTASTTNGNINLSPDGTGSINAIGGATSGNFLRITDANLTSGNLISGYVGNNTATGNLLSLSSGSSETTRLAVGAFGQTTLDAAGKGKSALILNQIDSGPIFAASASGTNRFLITNAGNITLNQATIIDSAGTLSLNTTNNQAITTGTGITTLGGNLVLNNSSSTTTFGGLAYTWPSSQTSNYVLSTNGSSTLSWSDPTILAGSAIYWNQANGSLFPKNSTVDAFIGGQATASAKFAFLNVNSGTPTASISGNSAGRAIAIDGLGNITTTAMSPITIGSASTGPIALNPKGSTGLYVDGTGQVGIGTTGPSYKLDVAGGNIRSQGGYVYFGTDGSLIYNTGGVLTFASNGGYSQMGSGQPLYFPGSSSASNSLLVNVSGDANYRFTLNAAGTMGWGAGSGATDTNLYRNAAGQLRTGGGLAIDGNVGIGTTSPGAKLHVENNTAGLARVIFTNPNTAAYQQTDIGIGRGTGVADLYIGTNYGAQNAFIDNRSGGGLFIKNSGTDTVTILTNGNVGIGTVSPQEILDVRGNLKVGSSDLAYIAFGDAGQPVGANTSVGIWRGNIAGTGSGNGLNLQGYDGLYLRVDGTHGTPGTNGVFIKSGGNVGIGTTTPGEKLDVSGNATVSGNLTLYAATPTIQSVLNRDLIFGGSTTGAINFADNVSSNFNPQTTSTYDLGTSSLYWNNLYVNNIISGGTTAGFWQRNSGAMAPQNISDDVLIGASATASAKFAFLNAASGTPTASISGNSANRALVIDGLGNITTTAMSPITIGSASTGPIALNPKGTTGLYVDGTGQVGIGTTGPGHLLDIKGTSAGVDSGLISFRDDRTTAGDNENYVFEITRQNSDTMALVLGNDNNGNGVIAANNADLRFGRHLGSFSEYMRVTNAGNVGIGTTSPAAKLDVSGSATVSGNLNLYAATPTIQSVLNRDLIFGGSTTGAINFADNVSSNFNPQTTSTYDLGTSSLYWNNLYVNNIYAPATGVSGYWQRNSGAISPTNLTDDLLLGTTATSSALFAFKNIASGTPTASISGNANGRALVIDGLGNITTTAKQSLTLGDSSTGNIILAPSGGTVGVGTTTPAATSILDLTSTTKGFLAPRMTTTQRDAISTPATGLMIYNTTTNQYNVYNGTSWGAVGGGGAWSDLTVPTANLTLAMDADTTTFNWDTLTTGTGFTEASASLSSGTLHALSVNSTAATGNTQKVLSLSTAGANSTSTQTTYGLYSTNTHTGTASTNIGGYFSASGGTNNYAAIFENGSIGIGNTTPLYKLDVTGTASVSADMLIGGQTQLGRFASNPTAVGRGSVIYNAGTDTINYWNGSSWLTLSNTGANYWTDGGTYVYPTAYESIRVYDAGGTDYMSLGHDGTNATFTSVNTTKYTFDKWIDITGALTTSGNIDINGTANDIAGTLNLSGNTLTSASDLTINAGGTKTIISDDLQISGGDLLGESGNIRITLSDALQRTDVTGLLSADRGATFSAAIAADTPLTLNNNSGALIYKVSNAGLITSGVTDSATAIAFNLDTSSTLSTQGSKLLSLKNNTSEKFYIDKDGNLYAAGTILSGNGAGMLMTNKSGGTVAVRSLVIIDTSNNSAFTTTTTAYAKTSFGVVTGVGLGVTNDANGDGVCNANDICMVAVGGEVNVTTTNASTASKGDYLYTTSTAGSAVASAKQFDGLIGVVSSTANAGSGYLKMIFKVQPQVTAAASIDKGSKHNEYWLYANDYTAVGNGSDTNANLLTRGMIFDNLSDTTKTDSANTTVSAPTQVQDTSATLRSINSASAPFRAGLIGGQTLATSTTDNAGNTYLGSNTVNKTVLYDRTRDSSPQVQVELGIDPNWYNGVTLSVATTSAQFSQNTTIVKNPSLSTTYNGSLLKVTGTYTTAAAARTIYVTIKSPTTFDWTDYNGNASTGVTMTPGTAQSLSGTAAGISLTFTGGTKYNTGDVFKIASWFVEPASSTRGGTAKFPERSYVIATASSVDIIDADTQKLWMRFSQGTNNLLQDSNVGSYVGISVVNGNLYVGANGATFGRLFEIYFNRDSAFNVTTSSQSYLSQYNGGIAARNGGNNYIAQVSTSVSIVNATVNDVSAAVIPNQPTQTMTVSGWGYIYGNNTMGVSESVNLPYKFNGTPNVTSQYAGYTAASAPTKLSDCSGVSGAVVANAVGAITTTSFLTSFNYGSSLGTNYVCYTWTATGQVSPRQYVAATTGSSSTDGGTTIINETDQSAVNLAVGSTRTGFQWQTNVALTNTGTLYFVSNDSNGGVTDVFVYYNTPTITSSETTWPKYFSGYYRVGTASGWASGGPEILGTNATGQINSLYVTQGTSTIDGKSNTIYVGTNDGLSVIQEKQSGGTPNDGAGNGTDGNDEKNGSVKYYTKDYISEEMVGDIRGMWPLSANGALSMSDASVKADTLTNNGTATAVTGVRGAGVSLNGSTQYLSCTDAACGGTSKLDIGTNTYSFGSWIKTSANNGSIISKYNQGVSGSYLLCVGNPSPGCSGGANGKIGVTIWDGSGSTSFGSNKTVNDNNWHYIIVVGNSSQVTLYIDGQLDSTGTARTAFDSSIDFYIGATLNSSSVTGYFSGSIDEPFVTATALTASQIKHMYEVGYRALQSHATTLGGGAADANQQLGYISTGTNVVGDARVDYNNQFMYVGTNSTTLGAVSKIDLNSDTNIKTYNSSANVPTGGPLLIDEDTKSLAVGYNLEAVGSATTGVKTMGVDNNATATSGNFVSKTVTTAESFTQAYIWSQHVLDSSDTSNTVQVWASNDGGSNYYQCNQTTTDTTQTPTEYEYFCQFNAAGSSLKIKEVFARGSTKTNTYLTRYGIAWIGSDAIGGAPGGNGLYTNNNSSVANGSYIDVVHNQNTSDVLTNGWINLNGQWKDVATATESGIISATNASVANGSYVELVHNQNTNDPIITGWKYNSSTSKWESVDDIGSDATGGTITYSGGYTIHTFTSSGTFTPGPGTVEYLVVGGGGGGGGHDHGSGGGAGGFRTATGYAVSGGAITVTVGGGGAGGTAGVRGTNGSDSVFGTITSTGGGGGGNQVGGAGQNGGSGGGTSLGGTAGQGTAGQGNNGGVGTASANYGDGGGGGAGAVGGNGTTTNGGAGGVGLASSISGSSVYYAGGGGGAIYSSGTPGAGGNGGGGAGSLGGGVNGTANTGGGGGGAERNDTGVGGNGGSGIVIVRYLTNSLAAFKIVQQDVNTVRLYNYSGATQNLRLNVSTQAFQIRQTDTNTVRLYNYSGSAQNLRLDVITGGLGRNAGTVSLAPAAADVDSQSNVNSIWVNKTGLDGTLLKLQKSGTDILNLSQAGGNAALALDQRLGGDIFTASASGSTKLVLSNGGNLGLGTTSPNSKLHAVTDDAVTGTDGTGGTITHGNGYTIHTFTSSGTFTPANAGNVEYLVVGGGGGASCSGGGGGGVLTGSVAVTVQGYTVTVGGGGSGGNNVGANGTAGSDSVFSSVTATGGGYGARQDAQTNGGNGGSGGGGSYGGTGGTGSSGGNAGGGSTQSGNRGCGGGGGGNVAGADGTTNGGGNGGNGTSSSISGSSVTYGGGGGGGNFGSSGTNGTGGAGGGGNAATAGSKSGGSAGTTNTGGGGGGAADGPNPTAGAVGGAGGSGIVIIRYLTQGITDVLTLDHTTSGTGANNIGTGILFRTEDSGGNTENAGRISGILANATDGTEQSALTFDTRGITYGSDVGTFATTSQAQFPTGNAYNAAFAASIGGTSYIYVTGGNNSGAYSTVYKSTVDTSGNVGTFSTTSQGQLPQALWTHGAVTAAIGGTQYAYVLGGYLTDGTTKVSTVYKATIDTSANIGTFSTTSQAQLPVNIGYIDSTVTTTIGGTQFIYVVGGYTSGVVSTVYKSTVDTSGNVGAFSTTSQGQLPQTLYGGTAVIANVGGTKYLYAIGGYNAAAVSTVYKATIDSSGNVGSFSTTSQGQLPAAGYLNAATVVTVGGTNYIYVNGGYLSGPTGYSTVYKATIDSSGNVGSFSTTSQGQLPAVLYSHNLLTAAVGGTQYLYTVGDAHSGYLSTVYKATIGPDTGSSTLTRRMKLDHAGNLTISGTITQSGNPDIAENVRVSDPSIAGGDVVAIDSSVIPSEVEGSLHSSRDDIYNRFVAKKADVPYSKQLLGVISSDPGIILNSSKNIVYDNLKSQANERPLVIAGRVPVKIDPDSEPIEVGDPLTASIKPGLAQKATKSGYVIAKALESWTGQDRILALIQYGYVSQQVVLDENKNLDVQFAITPIASRSSEISDIRYQILNNLGQTVNQIGVFSEAAIANMKAGLIVADKITTKTITIEDLLISPIADIDTLTVRNLMTTNATVSGTLTVNDLVSPTIDQINRQLSLVTSQYASASAIISSIQAKYTSFGAINSATTSGDPLNTSHLYQENLPADAIAQLLQAGATIADLNVTGSLFANVLNSNNCMTTNDAQQMTTCDNTLYLQPLASAPINLLAGLMTLTPDGNVTINGNLNVTGSVLARDITSGKSNVDQLSSNIATISGQLTANKISVNDLVLTTLAPNEAAGEVGSAAGSASIASSSAEIFIPNSKVGENTLIYVTPIGNTNNQVLYVKNKELCMPNDAQQMTTYDGVCLKGFTVAVPSTPSSDLRFNYWLIKTQ